MNALPNLRLAPRRAHSVLQLDLDPFADPAPSSLFDQIGRSIGDDLADKLIADFGGRRLYVPIAPAPGDRITSSIGLSAAIAMARTFGGDRLMIPHSSYHARRRAQIIAMRANNASISRIAHQVRCTERYVYKVLALERSAPPPAPVAEHFKRGSINRRH